MLTVALAFTAVLSGCTKSEPAAQPHGPAIELKAGVTAPAAAGAHAATPAEGTRSAVNDGDTFTAAVAGWETSGAPDYAAPCTWLSTFTAPAGTAQAVMLTPTRYYSGNSGVRTYMKAWYPAGTLGAGGKVSFADTPDGQTDVMLAAQIAGSGDSPPGELDFRHCLTQLRFRIASAKDLADVVTLTSITVKQAQLPTGIDLANDGVIYAGAANLPVPGIAGAPRFTPPGTAAGLPLLIKPFGQNYLTVDVVTSLGLHENIRATIDSDTQFIPGKAYTITLTYTGVDARPLGVTVTVSPWQDVPGGNSDLPI